MCYLGVNTGKRRGNKHLSFSVYTVILNDINSLDHILRDHLIINLADLKSLCALLDFRAKLDLRLTKVPCTETESN